MGLSEDEQRILKEIEDNLSATDPRLVQQVADTSLYRHSARVIRRSALGFVLGLGILVGFFTTLLPLAVVGFLVMLACLLVIEHHVRKLGRAGLESLTNSMRGNLVKGAVTNATKRWRDRWGRDEPRA
jgi:hypothetical protein